MIYVKISTCENIPARHPVLGVSLECANQTSFTQDGNYMCVGGISELLYTNMTNLYLLTSKPRRLPLGHMNINWLSKLVIINCS